MSMKAVGGIWGLVAIAIAGYAIYSYINTPAQIQMKPTTQGG